MPSMVEKKGVQAAGTLSYMGWYLQELAYNWMPDASKLLLGTKAANWTSTRGHADVGKVRSREGL